MNDIIWFLVILKIIKSNVTPFGYSNKIDFFSAIKEYERIYRHHG